MDGENNTKSLFTVCGSSDRRKLKNECVRVYLNKKYDGCCHIPSTFNLPVSEPLVSFALLESTDLIETYSYILEQTIIKAKAK